MTDIKDVYCGTYIEAAEWDEHKKSKKHIDAIQFYKDKFKKYSGKPVKSRELKKANNKIDKVLDKLTVEAIKNRNMKLVSNIDKIKEKRPKQRKMVKKK